MCWRGDLLWEGAGGGFQAINHRSMACQTLTADDTGRRIFGVAIRQDPPLAMTLEPTMKIRLWRLVEPALAFIACAAVLGLLVRVRLARTIVPFTFIALALVVAFFTEANFIGGVRPFDSGDDGLVYDGYARRMLQHLLAGDIVGALEGGEKVFYFTPGTRYLRAAEHVIFGESYLGYLSLMLALPILVFALFRRFLPLRWALALGLVFAGVPIGVLFGSTSSSTSSGRRADSAIPPPTRCFSPAALRCSDGRTADRATASRRRSAPAWRLRRRCSCGRTSRRRPEFCSAAPAWRRCGSTNSAA